MIGKTISRYRVVEKLGQGGMGTVYKAEDTRLHRTVALKFLTAEATGSREHQARFLKEAEAAAALEHPNITTIYDIGEEEGQTFIAMSFVDGKTLAEKIRERPLPLDEVLTVAIQVGEALNAAHRRGIVHRDIKPSNIMLTPEGAVKVMDFGLAHLAGQTRITKTGTIMGTPAYMSPEQAQGAEVDERSDIWSFGAVLYEMVTGKLPFRGDTDHAILRAILDDRHEPMTAIRMGIPPELDRIVGKALKKEPAQRYQNAADLIVDLRTLLSAGEPDSGKPAAPIGSAPSLQRGWRTAALALSIVLLAALVSLAVWWFRGATPGPLVPRIFSLRTEGAPEDQRISPDGQAIAYVTRAASNLSTLWIQEFDQPEPRVMVETADITRLRWSPDGSRIAYSHAIRRLSVVSTRMGSPHRLHTANRLVNFSWSHDGDAVYLVSPLDDARQAIFRVPLDGGVAELVFELDADLRNGAVEALPDVRHLLLSAMDPQGTSRVNVLNLAAKTLKPLVSGQQPVYLSTGHILFQSNAALMVVPFSLAKLEPTGEPFLLREGAANANVSQTGILSYLESGPGLQRLVWKDRQGIERGEIGQPQESIAMPVLSPDDNEVVVCAGDSETVDLWVHDVTRGLKRRVTSPPAIDVDRPEWNADGTKLVFSSNQSGTYDVYSVPADGSGEPESLLPVPGTSAYVWDWSTDDAHMIVRTRGDVYSLRPGADLTEAVLLVNGGPPDVTSPHLSPDGRFLVYESNESGTHQIYVVPFPDVSKKWQVSVNGGRQPTWRGDSREIYYVQGGDTLMAASVSAEPTFTVGETRRLFQDTTAFGGRGNQYDVTKDGQRLVVVKTLKEPTRILRVVENWTALAQDQPRQ